MVIAFTLAQSFLYKKRVDCALKSFEELSNKGIKLNITAVYTFEQTKKIYKNLNKKTKSIISIFKFKHVFVNDFNKLIDGAFVDLGNWSDYDIDNLPKTKDVYIIDYTFENVSWYKKIIARRLHAEAPVNRGKGYILRIPRLFVWLFWKLRRFQVS